MNWPRENFNDIFRSLLTVFIVIVAEDWNAVMYLYVRALDEDSDAGRPLAVFYFFCLFVVGNTILLALFTALLLKNFKTDLDEVAKKIEAKEERRQQRLNRKTSFSGSLESEDLN